MDRRAETNELRFFRYARQRSQRTSASAGEADKSEFDLKARRGCRALPCGALPAIRKTKRKSANVNERRVTQRRHPCVYICRLAFSFANGIVPPKGWKYRKWLVIVVGADNAGLPSRKEIDCIFAEAKKSLLGVRVRFGDPAEFADAVMAEEKVHPSLPVVRGDMPDTWIHGAMSLPEATSIHRRTTGDLITLGQLDTTLRAFGLAPESVAGLLDSAYRDAGLYSEHTWGMKGHGVRGEKLFRSDWRQRYEAGEYREFDATFQYHADYAHRARKAVRDGIKARMAVLRCASTLLPRARTRNRPCSLRHGKSVSLQWRRSRRRENVSLRQRRRECRFPAKACE